MKAIANNLKFEGVSLNFGRLAALRDINLECPAATITSLLGPNGAGKSTALAVAAGLLRPTAGHVVIGGRAVLPFSSRKGVSYLPQNSLFPGLLTGREVIDFAAAISGAGQKAYDEVLEVTSVDQILDRRVRELSGGWVRRLGLASCLVQPADVLLLDEPFVGLDPETLDRLLDRLACLAGAGTTLLIATHEFEVIDLLSPRIAILDDGELVSSFGAASGPSRELYWRALASPLPGSGLRRASGI